MSHKDLVNDLMKRRLWEVLGIQPSYGTLLMMTQAELTQLKSYYEEALRIRENCKLLIPKGGIS
jgi:hypothetical protein